MSNNIFSKGANTINPFDNNNIANTNPFQTANTNQPQTVNTNQPNPVNIFSQPTKKDTNIFSVPQISINTTGHQLPQTTTNSFQSRSDLIKEFDKNKTNPIASNMSTQAASNPPSYFTPNIINQPNNTLPQPIILNIHQANTEKPKGQNIFGNAPLNNNNRTDETSAIPKIQGQNLFASHVNKPVLDQNKLFQKDDSKNNNLKNQDNSNKQIKQQIKTQSVIKIEPVVKIQTVSPEPSPNLLNNVNKPTHKDTKINPPVTSILNTITFNTTSSINLFNNPPKNTNILKSDGISHPITTIPTSPSPSTLSSSQTTATFGTSSVISSSNVIPPPPVQQFGAMTQQILKYYYDSSLMKNVVYSNPEQFQNIITKKNSNLHLKLMLNLTHYFPSQKRQQHFATKMQTFQSLKFTKAAFCDKFVAKTNQTQIFKTFLLTYLKSLSFKLKTDQLIVHYFLNKVLQESKFYENFVVNSSFSMPKQHTLNLSLLNQLVINSHINFSHPLIRKMSNSVLKYYLEDRLHLLDVVTHIMNGKNKQYKFLKKQAINSNIETFLWNSYKKLSETQTHVEDWPTRQETNFIQKQYILQQQKIASLLVLATNRYIQSPKTPRFLNISQVFKTLDKQYFVGLCTKYNQYQLSIRLQNHLLDLLFNIIPIREAIYFSTRQLKDLKNNIWTSEVYNTILEGQSHQTIVFKNILLPVKKIYKFPGVKQYHENTIDSIEPLANNNLRWLIWLQLFLYEIKQFNQEDLILLCKKILSQHNPDFWQTTSYPNIKQFINRLMKKKDYCVIYDILIQMLGTQKMNTVQPVLAYISKYSQESFMFDSIYRPIVKLIQQHRRKIFLKQPILNAYFSDDIKILQVKVAFLTRCVVLNPSQLGWLQNKLCLTPLRNKNSNSKRQTGIKLLLLLLDSVAVFKSMKNYKILKYLFDALTSIIIDQTHIKLFSVAISIYFTEYRRNGLLKDLIQDIYLNVESDSEFLKQSMLQHLKAILSLPLLQRYFIIPQTLSLENRQMYMALVGNMQINNRYSKPQLQLEVVQRLSQIETGQSCWLLDLLHLLNFPLNSISIQNINLLLIKLSTPVYQYTKSQFKLISQFVQTLNKSSIIQSVLKNTSVIQIQNNLHTSTIGLVNHRLFSFEPQSRIYAEIQKQEISKQILNCLKVIESSLSLIQILQIDDEKLDGIKHLISQIKLVQNVNQWMCNKETIHHFQHDFYTTTLNRISRFNIIIAIASHIFIDYTNQQTYNQIKLPRITIKTERQVQQLVHMLSIIDNRLINNRQILLQQLSYSSNNSIAFYAVRILTKCLLCWQKILKAKKPSMYALLSSFDANKATQIQTLAYRQDIQQFFKLLLIKLIQTSKKNTYMGCQILDLLTSLLIIQQNTICVLFDKSSSGYNFQQMLEIVITNILHGKKYQRSQIPLIQKLLLFIQTLLYSPKFKEHGLRLTYKDFYIPDQIFSVISRDQILVDDEYVQTNQMLNLLNQNRLYFNLLRLSLIECTIAILIAGVINNQKSIYNHIDRIVRYLYLEQFPNQILDNTTKPTILFENLKQFSEQFSLPYKKIQYKFINFVDVNSFGYGRNYEIIPSKYKLEKLTNQQVCDLFSQFHQCNLLRSIEEVKTYVIKRWSQFFIIIANTGKHGFSLSQRLKDNQIQKVEHHFGSSFSLINSKMYKLQKGFNEIANNKLNLFERLTRTILSRFSQSELKQINPISEYKLGVLNTSLKTIFNLDPLYRIDQLMEDTFQVLRNLLRDCKNSKNSIAVSSLFSTVSMLYKTKKLNSKNILQTAINIFLSDDCVTKNIYISCLFTQISSKDMCPVLLNQFIEKIISLQFNTNLDPMDSFVVNRSLIQLCKKKQQVLLSYNYFSYLPIPKDINVPPTFYSLIWTYKLITEVLTKQYDQFIFTQVMKYLNKIQPIFKSILSDVPQTNYTQIPKYIFESKGEFKISLQYLFIYEQELKIVHKIFESVFVNQPNYYAQLQKYQQMFLGNNVLTNINKVRSIVGDELLDKVSLKKDNLQVVNKYKKNLLQFYFEIQSLQCMSLYLQCLNLIVLRRKQTQYNVEDTVKIFEKQICDRLQTNIYQQVQITQMLECYNVYQNSLQTSIRTLYTNQLKRKYTYESYIKAHKNVLQNIYEISNVYIKAKQNSLSIYQPMIQKSVKNFKLWVLAGQKKQKDIFKKQNI